MKKINFLTFILGCLCSIATVSAQTVSLTFTGRDATNNYVQLDSITITNLTKSWQETIYWPDTVLTLTNKTGISDVQEQEIGLFLYPNPFNGTSSVLLTIPQSEEVYMAVYNITGQRVMEFSSQLEAGINHIDIGFQKPQVYFLVVNTLEGRLVQKLVNVGHSGDNYIKFRSTLPLSEEQNSKIQKRQSSQPFSYGDMMEYVGYATINGNMEESHHITQAQGHSQTFILQFDVTKAILPTLNTTIASSITDTSAISGGTITSDGGAQVTARGVCWSTSSNPTINNSHTTNGSGTGSFTSNITGLTAGRTYYVRAYATNIAGTAYGAQISFTTKTTPTLTTIIASNITDSSAVCGGNITNDGGTIVTARGICWDTTSNPTINKSHTTNGSGMGSFTSYLTGLTNNTTYYVRAYATNAAGTAYGNQDTFTTIGMQNSAQFSVSATKKVLFSFGNLQWSATNGGNTATTHVVANGTAAGTWRFAPHQWDIIGDGNKNIDSTYTGWIDLFGWGTSGYYNNYPYMTSINGADYGINNDIEGTKYDWGVYNAIYNPKTRMTDASGTWRTLTHNEWFYLLNTRTTSSGIRYAKAKVNGVNGLIIVQDNWNTSIYTLDSVNSATAKYTYNTINATDWARMEAAGCVFLPAAGFRRMTLVRDVGAGGTYWSTTADAIAPGLYYGAFVVDFTNVDIFDDPQTKNPCCHRYVGISVRLVQDVSISVQKLPIINTIVANNITDSSAVSGGNITSNGGSSVVVRGVCWSTSPNPTINTNHTTNGSGAGSFTSNLTGLTSNTTYYIRAYATNAAGTAYGNQVTFSTTGVKSDTQFSVSATQKVLFSPGNLQWSATNGGNTATTHIVAGNGTAAGTWRFAPNQWDKIGSTNSSISSTDTGWIDLFGWGTSGYNNKYPYMTSLTGTDYGNGNNNIASTNYDWGVYNAIYNPKTNTTDAPGTWRTLTKDEWTYLLNTRTTLSGLRYAKATVWGKGGLIIVPDNWSTSIHPLDSTNTPSATYASNIISNADWATMENAGCVFLPSTGYRIGTSVYDVIFSAYYWSTTNFTNGEAYYLSISRYSLNPSVIVDCYLGHSVRLVKNVQ